MIVNDNYVYFGITHLFHSKFNRRLAYSATVRISGSYIRTTF